MNRIAITNLSDVRAMGRLELGTASGGLFRGPSYVLASLNCLRRAKGVFARIYCRRLPGL